MTNLSKKIFLLFLLLMGWFFLPLKVWGGDSKCCVYYEGDKPSNECLSLHTGDVAKCSEKYGIYPSNLVGGYIINNPRSSDMCAKVDGFAAYKIDYNHSTNKLQSDVCDKSQELLQINRDFQDKLFPAILAPIVEKYICEDKDCIKKPPTGKLTTFLTISSLSGADEREFLNCDPGYFLVLKENACVGAKKVEEKKDGLILPDVSGLNGLKKLGITGNAQGVSVFIGILIKAVMGIMGAIAFALFVYAGFLWMTGMGNSEKQGQAMKILVWASLGLIIILSSYAVVNFVFSFIS